jgi:hypothetical protein
MLIERLKAKLERMSQRLKRLDRTIPGRPSDRLDAYRRDPAQLMLDAGFTPDPWQAEFLRNCEQSNLMLCARQTGKSSVVAALALQTALTTPGATVVIIAQAQPQASELLRKVNSFYNRIGRPLKAVGQAITRLELENRSRVVALPGTEQSVHGYTADLLLVDEAARVKDQTMMAASPQLSVSKGRLVALTTAFVKTGWFYKDWTEGEGFRRWSITAKECPRHDAKFLVSEKRKMGERWFRMSYFNEFFDNLSGYFRSEDIEKAFSVTGVPVIPLLGVESRAESSVENSVPVIPLLGC